MKITKNLGIVAACTLATTVHGYAQTSPDATASPAASAPQTHPYKSAMRGGELVQNGDFETTVVNASQFGDTNELPGWSAVTEENAQGAIARDDAAPPGPAGPHALRLTATRLGRRCGAANSGESGHMAVRAGIWYDISLFCRTADKRHTALVFSLESRDGRTICARATIPEVGGDWQAYTLSLHTDAAAPRARLVISPIDPGVLWLDGVSLVPRPAHGGTVATP